MRAPLNKDTLLRDTLLRDTLLRDTLRKIRFLVLDVDGVLTDGRIFYSVDGGEWKGFHVHDGMGIRLALQSGLGIAIVTSRRSGAVERRAKELGVEELHQGVGNKLEWFDSFLQRRGLREGEVCFVGDDLVDLPVLRRAGFPATVPGAVPEVLAVARYVTERGGGFGAVREVVEMILKSRGAWDEVVDTL